MSEMVDVKRTPKRFNCLYCKSKAKFNFSEVVDHCIIFHKDLELKFYKTDPNQGDRIKNFHIIPREYEKDNKILIPNESTEKIKISKRQNESPIQTPKKILLHSTPTKNSQHDDTSDNNMNEEDFLNDSFTNLSVTDFNITETSCTRACQTEQSFTVPLMDEMTPADIPLLQSLSEMLPKVIATLREYGHEDKYLKFNSLLMQNAFPMQNIAYLLFLDVIEWFSNRDSHVMRYSAEVRQFWHIGSKLFKGKFLRFMGGWKNQGQCPQRNLDPKTSSVNFVVPDRKVLVNDDFSNRMKNIAPGIIQEMIDLIYLDDTTQSKTYKLCLDGKKINMGVKNQEMGDINLWGNEGPPTLNEKKAKLKSELLEIDSIRNILDNLEKREMKLIKDMPEYFMECFISKSQNVVCTLGRCLRELRQMKVNKTMTLEKLKKICTSDEIRKKYCFAISGIKTFLYQVEMCIGHTLKNIDDLCYVVAEMNGVPKLFCRGPKCNLSVQSNYKCLLNDDDDKTQGEYKSTTDLTIVKQRSQIWSDARGLAKVTGSTLHKAIGLDGLKKQQQHYDKVVRSLSPPEFTDIEKQRLRYGTDNEINAIATLVSKFLPVFYPDITYFEEGCYGKFEKEQLFLLVSPDGSGRKVHESNNTDVMYGIEIKCPFPGKIFTTPVYYKMPFYYVIQVLSEMAVLKTNRLFFLSYSSESTSVFQITFDEILWNKIYQLAKVIYIDQENHYPKKLQPELSNIRNDLKAFCDQNVEFIVEIKSVLAQECNHVDKPIGVFRNHCSHVEDSSQVTVTNTVEGTQSLLFEINENVTQAFSLCRCMASEVLVFMLSDLDRIHENERQYSCPVAYGMKGYSLTTSVLRNMVDELLARCFHSGLYVPIVSYDGQWFNMAIRSASNKPLTMLQLQKDVYREAKSIPKADFIKLISTSNVVKASSFNDLCDQIVCSIPTDANGNINGGIVVETSKTKNRPIKISQAVYLKLKTKVPEVITNDDETEESEFPLLATDGLDESTVDILRNVQLPNISERSCFNSDLSNELETIFQEPDGDTMENTESLHRFNDITETDSELQSDLLANTDGTMSPNTNRTGIQNERNRSSSPVTTDNVSNTIFLKIKNKLNDVIKTSKRPKWKTYTIEQFIACFNSSATVSEVFTKAELNICLQVIQEETTLPVHYAKSWNKEKLAEQLTTAIYDPLALGVSSKGRRRNRPLFALKTLCLKVISKYPKTVINVINAEINFPLRLTEWRRNCPFAFPTTIKGLETDIMWYSMPEYVQERCIYMFHLLDCHHLLTNARIKCCSSGIKESGIHKEAWLRVARDSSNNSSGLNLALVEDLVDKQNNAFAKKTFSKEVEDVMRSNGDVNEANFCHLMRTWYNAEDDPGIPAIERCRRRMAFREWLLSNVDFSHFPPPGSHIKGIPLVMFEGILTNIERRMQMFPFIKKGAYNIRSLGSLEVENLFGAFQDLDPKGSGIIRPDDIPKAISTACELMHARLDKNRVFHMNTSKAKVYPVNELIQATNMNDGTLLLHQDCVNSIALCDHIFDLPQRRDRKAKRKRNHISEPAMCSRGARPVREFHKIDESKILPHRRFGIDIQKYFK